MKKSALVILSEGFEEIEAITPIDLLRRAGISVVMAALGSRTVRGAHGITVLADEELKSDSALCDAIVLPGGQQGTSNLAASDLVVDLVASYFAAGRICAAICAAPLVLAKAGILAARRVACYPGIESMLGDARISQSDVVTDGNIITSRGAGTAVAFAIALIESLENREIAWETARKILYSSRSV